MPLKNKYGKSSDSPLGVLLAEILRRIEPHKDALIKETTSQPTNPLYQQASSDSLQKLEKITKIILVIQEKLKLFDEGNEPSFLDMKNVFEGTDFSNLVVLTAQFRLDLYLADAKQVKKIAAECEKELKSKKISPINYENYEQFRNLFIDKLEKELSLGTEEAGAAELKTQLTMYKSMANNLEAGKKYTLEQITSKLCDSLSLFLKSNDSLPFQLIIAHPQLYPFMKELNALLSDTKWFPPTVMDLVGSFLKPVALQFRPFTYLEESVNDNPYVYKASGIVYNLDTYYHDYTKAIGKALNKSMLKFEISMYEAAIEEHKLQLITKLNNAYSTFIKSESTKENISSFLDLINQTESAIDNIATLTFKEYLQQVKVENEFLKYMLENESQFSMLSQTIPQLGLEIIDREMDTIKSQIETYRTNVSSLIKEPEVESPVEPEETFIEPESTSRESKRAALRALIAEKITEIPQTLDDLVENPAKKTVSDLPVSYTVQAGEVVESAFISELRKKISAYNADHTHDGDKTIDNDNHAGQVLTLQELIENPAPAGSQLLPTEPLELFKLQPGAEEAIQVLSLEDKVEKCISTISTANVQSGMSKNRDEMIAESISLTMELAELWEVIKPGSKSLTPAQNLDHLILERDKYESCLKSFNQLSNGSIPANIEQINNKLELLSSSIKKIQSVDEARGAIQEAIELFNEQARALNNEIGVLNLNDASSQPLIETKIKSILKLQDALAGFDAEIELGIKAISLAQLRLKAHLKTHHSKINFVVSVNDIMNSTLNINNSLVAIYTCIRELSTIKSQLDAGQFYAKLHTQLNPDDKASWDYLPNYERERDKFISKVNDFLSEVETTLKAKLPQLPDVMTADDLCVIINQYNQWKSDLNLVNNSLAAIERAGYAIEDCRKTETTINEFFNTQNDKVVAKINEMVSTARDAVAGIVELDGLQLMTKKQCENHLNTLQRQLDALHNAKQLCEKLQEVIEDSHLETGTSVGQTLTSITEAIEKQNSVIEQLKPITHRHRVAELIVKSLEKYSKDRDFSWYLIKDFFFDDDVRRSDFTQDIVIALGLYIKNSDAKTVLNLIKQRFNEFPGKNLQPLLNRIMLQLKEEPLTNEQKDHILVDGLSVLTELNGQSEPKNPFVNGLNELDAAIIAMQEYSLRLPEKDAQVVNDLGNQLKVKFDQFLIANKDNLLQGTNLPKETVDTFKEDFGLLLHSQDDKMHNHHGWKRVVTNLAIGLASLGTLLVASLVYTKYFGSGRAHLFFDKTQRLENLDSVADKLDIACQAISPALQI